MIIQEFNNAFEVDGEFKRTDLENALLEKYFDLHFSYFKGLNYTNDYGEKEIMPKGFSCFCKEFFGSYTYSTKELYETADNALAGLFIENKNKLKGIVKRVYNVQ